MYVHVRNGRSFEKARLVRVSGDHVVLHHPLHGVVSVPTYRLRVADQLFAHALLGGYRLKLTMEKTGRMQAAKSHSGSKDGRAWMMTRFELVTQDSRGRIEVLEMSCDGDFTAFNGQDVHMQVEVSARLFKGAADLDLRASEITSLAKAKAS